MNPRRSLFIKVLLWFFLSLVLLIAILVGIFNLNVHLRPDSAIVSGLGGHGKALGEVILRELYDSDYYDWGSILQRFGEAYHLELLLCLSNGRIVAGAKRELPTTVTDALHRVQKGLNMRPLPYPAFHAPVPMPFPRPFSAHPPHNPCRRPVHCASRAWARSER